MSTSMRDLRQRDAGLLELTQSALASITRADFDEEAHDQCLVRAEDSLLLIVDKLTWDKNAPTVSQERHIRGAITKH